MTYKVHRIPPDDSGGPNSPAARVPAKCNVLEAREAPSAQPEIEEAERFRALRNEVVVQQRNNATVSTLRGQVGARRWTAVDGKMDRHRGTRAGYRVDFHCL